ncbi:TetR/AcrR family transcriptional regulator [Actinokineospora globicatena]|uniref:TetR/AcrR family transcriptional regulator n=1 Tax=Actinokineospora globicatena TaxID=103729 RepID=UPI0020A3C251|nr:TetR/AcrR family transcriptional regulator [Actinokineospora globicatena]MCP2302259.1 transcriptional regulator, TetR family [Actinokineospora globicatena]GLW76075.1 TetR family transcriptional regulator [Actinokineospora globicatena]GLW82910.1 TetR family transcriptional regulator [Actinokineospora globicatena]
MATYASVSGKRQTAVTPARIVAAALGLTARHGLENWTLRQLSGEIGAYPAVVYHHVGDRESVVAAVLDQVVAELPLPAEDLPWRQWFERLLTDARPVLRRHPGTARRLAVRGDRVPALRELIDRGLAVLRHAGFGDEAVAVNTLLLTHAWQSIATEDDRDRDAPGDPDISGPEGTDEGGVCQVDVCQVDVFHYGLARILDGIASQPDGQRTPVGGQRASSSLSSPHDSASATDS